MIPAQREHLKRIDAHLANLLSTAEKRTGGEWIADFNCTSLVFAKQKRGDYEVATVDDRQDAAFIASCAGNAEAGWRATRAAIADWLSLYSSTEGYADGAPDATAHDKLCNKVASICRINLQHILAAFPLESLKP